MLIMDGSQFCGTAFAFRTGRYYVTAHHCVRDLDPATLAVKTIKLGEAPVARIERHPSTDLAQE